MGKDKDEDKPGRHEDSRDRDGHKEGYDHANTIDVNESGGGKHSEDDK